MKGSVTDSCANSHRLEATKQIFEDVRKVQVAIISVFDKSKIVLLGKFLKDFGVQILSSGNTCKILKEAGVEAEEVSSYTNSPEIFDGRVKTLHPKIHGGILYCRGNSDHEEEAEKMGIKAIDLVVVDLYPFEKSIQMKDDFNKSIENIDIGGPCMLRAAAKNHSSVCVLSSISQYEDFMEVMKNNNGSTTTLFRRKMAAEAFRRTASYDALVFNFLDSSNSSKFEVENITSNNQFRDKYMPTLFSPSIPLKYGCNPHQFPAAVCTVNGGRLPFTILNGSPGYINFLDAILAFQLVKELQQKLGVTAAASFKHCSPAGAAIGRPLSALDYQVCDIPPNKNLSLTASAYVLARNADPLCSFGDFIGISSQVEEDLANIIRQEVSDGIVAPSFSESALEILKQKKGGNFVILQADVNFSPPEYEMRQIFGVGFIQKRDTSIFEPKLFNKSFNFLENQPEIPDFAKVDLALASIALKYTQSNSVVYAKNCQLIGVGAGQQSRVDCVKLAGKKSAIWFYRHHPKILNLPFRKGIKRQEKVNLRVEAIEGEMNDLTASNFASKLEDHANFSEFVLTPTEKVEFLKTLKGVSMSSDAFFPFRDSIDQAFKYGVQYAAHSGGSVQDNSVIQAATENGISLFCTGIRAFLH